MISVVVGAIRYVALRGVASLRLLVVVETVKTDDALNAASVWTQRSLGPMKSNKTTALVAARSMLSLRG